MCVAHVKEALERMGHEVAQTTIRRILRARGYSLRAKKKNSEGKSHPDRDAQFEHIHTACQEFEQQGDPIISVDCKKKELIGQFKNNGAEWHAKGEHTEVHVYDFLSLADGKAIPYGIYDLVHNHGFVTVGIDHETAEFAVESIRRWWQQRGKTLYAGKRRLLITADGGGSNGVRNRLWKKKLQELADEEQLAITVAHYPPATVPLEYDRAPPVFFHFHQLARQAAHLLGSRSGMNFAYDHQRRFNRHGAFG